MEMNHQISILKDKRHDFLCNEGENDSVAMCAMNSPGELVSGVKLLLAVQIAGVNFLILLLSLVRMRCRKILL